MWQKNRLGVLISIEYKKALSLLKKQVIFSRNKCFLSPTNIKFKQIKDQIKTKGWPPASKNVPLLVFRLTKSALAGGRLRPRRRAQPFTKIAGSERHGALPNSGAATAPVTAWAEAWMGKDPHRREGELARHTASDSQISPKGRKHA